MFEIIYYQNSKGEAPVKEFIESLLLKRDKQSRIRFRKVSDYIGMLELLGKAAGEPYVKHIGGSLWELRPLDDRLFFAAAIGNEIVLLHHFVKKTRRTPRREIDKALRNLEDWKKWSNEYEDT